MKGSFSKAKNYAILLPNSLDYMIAYFTITNMDKIIVPISIEAKEPEIKSTLSYCEVGTIFTNSKYKERIIKYCSNYEYKIQIFDIDNLTIVELNPDKPEFIDNSDTPSEKDTAIMLHTSGTTSNPKRQTYGQTEASPRVTALLPEDSIRKI
ncbi:AMP-binding protein [Anaerocolumna jejuensis]|uniref:AMP-binding protein n=1 Tax=Anaerocolumna jejuensis TaxID=259063 RepID=UPI003F7BA4FF